MVIRPDLTGHLNKRRTTTIARKDPVLEFATYADGWRWSLSDDQGRLLVLSKRFESRQSADRNANLVLGPHQRTPLGTDGNGFEVAR